MGLDYDFPIRKLLPFRDVSIVSGLGLAVGHGFSWPKHCLLVACIYLHLFHSFPGLRRLRNGWMGMVFMLNYSDLLFNSCSGWGGESDKIALNEFIVPKENSSLGMYLGT